MHLSVSRETYDRIERTNSTLLRHLQRSPKHYEAQLTRKAAGATESQRIGKAVHIATLEPERFRATYAVWEGERRDGKKWDAFKANNRGFEILKENEYQLVQSIANAALSDPRAAKYLSGGAAEATLLWTHVEPATLGSGGFSIECKARLDMVHAGTAIVDLKTTRDASPKAFSSQCFDLGTHIQLAMYQDAYAATNGGEILPVKVVAVENRSPFVVQVYSMDDEILELGRITYRGLLQTLACCRNTGRYRGYYDGELELELPRWARPATDEDADGLGVEFSEADAA